MPHITPDGNYTEALNVAEGSVVVPERPTIDHVWNGSVWVYQLPSKALRINELLLAKGVTRLLVQLTIEVSEDKAKALAASYGLTDEQALAYAYSKNKTYRECKDLEVAIRAIEVEP